MFTEHVQSRAAKRAETNQKVLASAERLFRERGFGPTTIRQIAADADVSVGTVMTAGDKDALLVAIFDGWIAAVHDGRTVEHGTKPTSLAPPDAAKAVMDLFQPFIDYFARDRQLSREYAAIIVRGSHESAIFQNLALALIAEIHAVLTQSGFTRDDAASAAQVIYFSYLGLVMTGGNGAMQSPIDQLRDAVGFVVSHRGEAQ